MKAGPEDRAEPMKAQPEAHGSPEADLQVMFLVLTFIGLLHFSQLGGFGLLFFSYHHNCSSAGLSTLRG